MATNGLSQSNSIIFNNLSGQFSIVYASMTPDYISYSPLQHQQATLAFVISALLNILQLKSHSPFDTHPKLMKMAVIFFFLYGFGCIVESRITVSTLARYYCIIQQTIRLVGYFSLATLASILFCSDSVWPLLFLVFAFFVMGMLWHWLLMHCKVLKEGSNSNFQNYYSRTSFFQAPVAVISTYPV
ncbi:hypothetical protein DCAR_0418302 [Daucus carota subsp. sativus]|uniref:Uncharacterized protein n=1 Tax=Daucus carota subsp. sativus TaxID=79200 RepID=A0AAF1B043_DAUCS|nr:hypothetical protein DCAR_0418302 [Daucus carota subsp. sativus]